MLGFFSFSLLGRSYGILNQMRVFDTIANSLNADIKIVVRMGNDLSWCVKVAGTTQVNKGSGYYNQESLRVLEQPLESLAVHNLTLLKIKNSGITYRSG